MASIQALSSAAQDRKARLAQLKSLKRKQPDTTEDQQDEAAPAPKSPRQESTHESSEVTSKYLSGRNYDAETRGAKLGFETAPDEGKETLEKKAAALAAETKRQAEEEEKAAQPLDLFKLQPKKPNWDLKRDLDRKLDILNVRTDNAIARLVRERISGQQKAAQARAAQASTNGGQQTSSQSGDVEAMGIEGTTLVEATNIREREDEEEARREREEEEALLDGS
ncbi:Pre-mRNA-splicing factor cwf18 [Pseudocercospora fuligena]|uniref:Pre-mRNA-splicing factor cwf18 n=1 Tax=Pseudocercospora fuligena TaxID=685502 RepID=A0A8H6REU9_9PEZI|nr:Pre-mRNA-splicing factor cwf18 [Pseudocercospora fuligena]